VFGFELGSFPVESNASLHSKPTTKLLDIVKQAVSGGTKKSGSGLVEGNFSDRVLYCYVNEIDVLTPTLPQ
jgi:hypothetical protein